MTNVLLVPEAHAVYNEFDKQGLLLGLKRLEEERNPEYKQRLLDIFINRAGSSYHGLINGITRELGLSISNTMTVEPVLSGSGVPVLTFPAITFEETKCTLYSDYGEGIVLLELDRYDLDGGAWTIEELVDQINGTSYFTATLFSGVNEQDRSMTIFNQTSVPLITSEDISGRGALVKLENENLVAGTVSVSSTSLSERVYIETDLRHSGQYYVNLEDGIILTTSVPDSGSVVRYQYRNDEFIVRASPVIIHNLQSDDFKRKLFRITTEEELGLPTELGAFVVNELLSVFPSTYGP